MKKTHKGHLGKALLMGTALVSLSAVEAQAVTGTGSVSAIVLAPITVTNQTTLHFGSFTIANATTGTVVIPAATGGAGRSVTGGVNDIAGAGLESAGALRITAATAVAMDVAMQAGPFVVTGAGPDMTLSNFHLVTDAGGTTATVTIPATATFIDVPVGATLTTGTGALQTAGTYTGTYNVDVTYQ